MAAFKKQSGRQQPIVAVALFDFTQLVSAAAKGLIELPPGAEVLSGAIVTTIVWNSGTSDVAVVGDAGSANRYRASATFAAVGRYALTPTGYVTTAPTNVTITWTGAGTAITTGSARLMVEYIVHGRSQFNQGLDD